MPEEHAKERDDMVLLKCQRVMALEVDLPEKTSTVTDTQGEREGERRGRKRNKRKHVHTHTHTVSLRTSFDTRSRRADS